jgi:Kelch motif
MNTPRAHFSAVLSSNCSQIIVIGGVNESGPLAYVERYDIMTGLWENLAPMKNKRQMHAAWMANIEMSQFK